MTGGTLLDARDLSYAYPAGRRVLAGASLVIRAGESVALVGANGGGKTTLLKILLGTLCPDGGEVQLAGQPLAGWGARERGRRIAYVPQIHAVPFPYLVRDLVALGRIPSAGLLRRLGAADRAAVDGALARLGIAHLAGRPYTELSGGERQLCLIARALVQEARILLLDEPTTGLDYGNQWRLLALVRELAAEGRAVVQSTHYPDHVLGAADRAVLLHGGRILADGVPDAVVTPASIRTLYGLEVTAFPIPGGPVALVPDLELAWAGRSVHA